MRDEAFVYILASKPHGTLYIGVTNNIVRRVAEHKAGINPGFTQRYHVKMLVFVERFNSIKAAIEREKQLKGWHRAWKIRLIREQNPYWHDLSELYGVTDEHVEAMKEEHNIKE